MWFASFEIQASILFRLCGVSEVGEGIALIIGDAGIKPGCAAALASLQKSGSRALGQYDVDDVFI